MQKSCPLYEMIDDLWGQKGETDCHSQFANWLRNDGEICNTAGNKCTMHALAVGPSRQKIPDIVECHDTERVWEVTKRDALCTHWLSGLPDVKWPLTVQLTTLTIKGHFMKLLGSVICVTSLSAVYRLSLVNASVWHFICLTSQFLYERKVFGKPLKRSVLLCVYILSRILQFARWNLA